MLMVAFVVHGIKFTIFNKDFGDDDQKNNNRICCVYLLSPSFYRGCVIFSVKNMYEIVNKDLCPVSPFTIFKT